MPLKPVADWTIEDVLGDLERLHWRAARAPSTIDRATTTGEDALNLLAKEVLDGLSDGSAEQRLAEGFRVATVRSRTVAHATQTITYLATALGAKECRKVIQWLRYKGVVSHTYSTRIS